MQRALCLEKIAEIQAGENSANMDKVASEIKSHLLLLPNAIPWTGVLLSMCILAAVAGSWLALKKLDQDWRDNIDDQHSLYLPNPKGGGKNAAFLLGFVPPALIPVIFAVAWVIILRR